MRAEELPTIVFFDTAAFGKEIARRRREQGLGLRAIAEAVGLSHPSVLALERGGTSNPSIHTIFGLSTLFGINPNRFMLKRDRTVVSVPIMPRWSADEEAVVQKLSLGEIDLNEATKRLPYRSRQAIIARAITVRGKPAQRRWTEEELALLRQFVDGRAPIKELQQALPNRSYASISIRLARLRHPRSVEKRKKERASFLERGPAWSR